MHAHACHSSYVEILGQFAGVSSLFSLGDQTQVIRSGNRCLLQLSHLDGPQ